MSTTRSLWGRPGRVEVDTAGRRLSQGRRRGADGGALPPSDLRDRDALSWFPDKTQRVQIPALRLPHGAGQADIEATAFGQVTKVEVDGYLSEGLVATGPLDGPPSRVTFANNVVTSHGAKVPADQRGIDVLLGAVAQVTGNTVSGGVCTRDGCGRGPITAVQAVGISAGSAVAGTKIDNNRVSDTDIGIRPFDAADCCAVTDIFRSMQTPQGLAARGIVPF